MQLQRKNITRVKFKQAGIGKLVSAQNKTLYLMALFGS